MGGAMNLTFKPARSKWSFLYALIRNLILAYVALVAFMYLDQQHLMYHPDPTPFDPRLQGMEALQPFDLRTSNGLTIRSWYAPPSGEDTPTIVFFQGNTGNLATHAYKYKHWLDEGLGVFLIGYRGFGNPGSPSENALYEDSRETLFKLMDRSDRPKKLIFYGESLGTGIAAQMALELSPAGLILESPFTSYPDVGANRYPYLPVHLLARDQYDTLSKIGKINVPILLMHGRVDQTVPFEEGQKVFDTALEPKTAFFVDQADHNNLYDFGAAEAVDKFLAGL